jgi:hypothetical protein
LVEQFKKQRGKMTETEVIAMIGTVIALVTAWIALRQNVLHRKAIQAQTFLTIVNTAREIQFSKGMDLIRSFKYNDYQDYKSKESQEVQDLVRSVVDFLNDLMHMIKHGYLTKEHVLNIYYLSILACADRLLPWWLDGFRKEHGSRYYYENFQQLCTQIKALGEGKLLDWDTKYKLG